MSTKIIAFLDDQQFSMVAGFFPDSVVIKISSVEELYLESIEGFMLFFFDHRSKISQKLSGIDKFINSFNGHNSFGLQTIPNSLDKEIHFLQYVPLRRFSFKEFMDNKPWLVRTQEMPARKHIRLSMPIPVEVIRSNLYKVSVRTSAEDLSIRGMKIIGDFTPGENIKIKSPLVADATFEGVVRWSVPWGKLGQIAYGGVELLHDQKSLSYRLLVKFMKEIFIPNLSRSGKLE